MTYKSKRNDKALLLQTAKEIATSLRIRSKGTRLKIRRPKIAWYGNTGGWYVVLGNLGKEQPTLELWFDKFSGYSDRKFFACYRTDTRRHILSMIDRVEKKLWPARTITTSETDESDYFQLEERLALKYFASPVLEKYSQGSTFFGVYDPTSSRLRQVDKGFCERAASFFEDIARSLPNSKETTEEREVYPKCENRKIVESHIRRERSGMLAAERKKIDKYKCQVCRIKLEEMYGELGESFAEAHHITPLSKLKENVKTRIEDLITVCPNCHRILHRMSGSSNDIQNLRIIIKQRRRKR